MRARGGNAEKHHGRIKGRKKNRNQLKVQDGSWLTNVGRGWGGGGGDGGGMCEDVRGWAGTGLDGWGKMH